MTPKRQPLAIAKPSTPPHRRRQRHPQRDDPLSGLPADVIVHILEQVCDDDLPTLPQVCLQWRRLFEPSSPLEPIFRTIIRNRFGLPSLPHTRADSWGRLYLALRREQCHLCPNFRIAPCVYAASAALTVPLSAPPHPTNHLALFPVCMSCFHGLLRPRPATSSFIPVIDHAYIQSVFPSIPDLTSLRRLCPYPVHVCRGFLYSDLAHLQPHPADTAIRYVLAKPIAARLPHLLPPCPTL